MKRLVVLGVWHRAFQVKVEKAYEAHTVSDLVFCLFIAEIVKALQNVDLEHQDEIVSCAVTMFFRLGSKDFLEFQTGSLPS